MQKHDSKIAKRRGTSRQVFSKNSRSVSGNNLAYQNMRGSALLIPVLLVAIIIIIVLVFLKSNGSGDQKRTKAITIGTAAKADFDKGDYESAEKKYSEAIALTTELPNLYSAAITTIAQRGNATGQEAQAYERAQPYIEQALKKYPNDEKILLSIGYSNETIGKYEEALNFYNKAIEQNSDDANAWFHKGHALEFLNRLEEANQAYDKSYSLDSQNPAAVIAQARVHARKGNTKETLKYLKQATTLTTISPQLKSEAFTNIASIESANIVAMETAINYGKQAADTDPSSSAAAAMYGYLQAINGSPAEGIDYLEKAIALNPRITRNYYLMGIVLRSGGYDKEAANFFSYALQRIDNDNTLVTNEDKIAMKGRLSYAFAQTVSKLGDQPLALQFLKQAVDVVPEYKKVVKNDMKYKFFSGLAGNKEFQTLIAL